MGDDEHGHAALGKVDHDLQHLLDHLRIEGRGGLVEQHDVRLHAERAGDGHALLLTARELAGVFQGLLRDFDPLEVFHGDLLRLVLGHLAHPDRREGAVLQHGQVWKQIELLEHHADLAADRVDVLEVVSELDAIDDHPAFLMLLQPVDAADQRRLA